MKKLKIAVIFIITLFLFGCLDFTRYKTGKVLKTGEDKIVLGEPIIVGNDKGVAAIPVPKIAYSAGTGKGYEVGITFNLISLSLELRKQLLYEEKTGINMTLDGSVCSGVSVSGGLTVSKTIAKKREPYLGIRYNKYYEKDREKDSLEDKEIDNFERSNQISSVQLTAGAKIPISNSWSWYTEMNIYRYTEEHEKLRNDALVVFGAGIAKEWK